MHEDALPCFVCSQQTRVRVRTPAWTASRRSRRSSRQQAQALLAGTCRCARRPWRRGCVLVSFVNNNTHPPDGAASHSTPAARRKRGAAPHDDAKFSAGGTHPESCRKCNAGTTRPPLPGSVPPAAPPLLRGLGAPHAVAVSCLRSWACASAASRCRSRERGDSSAPRGAGAPQPGARATAAAARVCARCATSLTAARGAADLAPGRRELGEFTAALTHARAMPAGLRTPPVLRPAAYHRAQRAQRLCAVREEHSSPGARRRHAASHTP
jgi:hypothetical protein